MHYKEISAVLTELNSNLEGLSQEEVKRRLITYGKNVLEEERESRLEVLIRQFTSPFILILMIAGVVALFLGDLKDAIVVYAIVLVNGLLGFYQELRAMASIEALKSLTSPKIRVFRDGKEVEIDSADLVPGDIVLLGEGDIVPADIRLIESVGLLVDEAILTGESLPVEKDASIILSENTPLYERANCLYKGTVILKGKAKGIVFATGKNTEMGKIAEKVQEKTTQSPLTRALGSLGKKWIFILFLTLSILVLIGYFQGRDMKVLVFFAIAQLVSAVPEGLPIVITIALVVGAIRLSKEKVLAKYLPAVETLGSATYICSDKTGTITTGKLTVFKYQAFNKDKLFLASALCNDSDGSKGDPLEIALLKWLETEGIDWENMRKSYQRIWEEPFDPKKRYMAVIASSEEGFYECFVKGALESLAPKINKISNHSMEKIWKLHNEMAEEGLRVLAFCYARLENLPKEIGEIGLELVGLIGFVDPPKEGVKEAVESAKSAGIKVIMITGDNLLTAKAIAKIVSIYEEEDLAIEGKDLGKYSDEELYEELKRIKVVARATPEDKYRIVKVLQSKGEIVAVTGDGVNDAPALRIADLGVAMGSGSQAAKDASKMIILDDNLSIIVNAIRRGRLIAKNIAKVIRYLLSTNAFEISYNSLAILSGLPLPLYATQILWINLVTDGVQDKAYPFTKYEGNPMLEKPKKPSEVFLGKSQIFRIAYNGLLMGLAHYFLFSYLVQVYPYEIALTISFCSAVVSQWAVGFQEISENPFLINPINYIKLNPYILLGISIGAILQFCAVYLFSQYFHAVALPLNLIPYVIIAPLLTFFGIELRKLFQIKFKR